jgi:hypothetical protein
VTGPAGKIQVWGLDSACGRVVGDDIFVSFLEILKTVGLQIEGAIYIMNPVHTTEHCAFLEAVVQTLIKSHECKIILPTSVSSISLKTKILKGLEPRVMNGCKTCEVTKRGTVMSHVWDRNILWKVDGPVQSS